MNDIDLAYVGEAGEHAVALGALVQAAAYDLGDFFEFEIGAAERSRSTPIIHSNAPSACR